jgi:hypothetical protein
VTIKPEDQAVNFEHYDFMVSYVRRPRTCWFTPDQPSRPQTRFALRKNSRHRLFRVAFDPRDHVGLSPRRRPMRRTRAEPKLFEGQRVGTVNGN